MSAHFTVLVVILNRDRIIVRKLYMIYPFLSMNTLRSFIRLIISQSLEQLFVLSTQIVNFLKCCFGNPRSVVDIKHTSCSLIGGLIQG